jgi:hypothetical protein
MNRSKLIMANKINGLIKSICDKIDKYEIVIGSWSSDVILVGKTSLEWNEIEPMSNYFVKKNIEWRIIFENNQIRIRIWR